MLDKPNLMTDYRVRLDFLGLFGFWMSSPGPRGFLPIHAPHSTHFRDLLGIAVDPKIQAQAPL